MFRSKNRQARAGLPFRAFVGIVTDSCKFSYPAARILIDEGSIVATMLFVHGAYYISADDVLVVKRVNGFQVVREVDGIHKVVFVYVLSGVDVVFRALQEAGFRFSDDGARFESEYLQAVSGNYALRVLAPVFIFAAALFVFALFFSR